MKRQFFFFGVAALVMGIWFLVGIPSRTSPQQPLPVSETYLGLRDLILKASRTKLGIPAPSSSTEPWGVVMDWGLDSGTATVVAIADGSASIYVSSGGGSIGGGEAHPAIHDAAVRAVKIAGELPMQGKSTSLFPLPDQQTLSFYFLTDDGVFTASASQEELMSRRHPLWKLAEAMQEIITQYRKIQQDPAPAR